MYRCVYYPNFEPNPVWLRRTLLVVDQVVRIVPDDANHIDSPWLVKLQSLLPVAVVSLSPQAQHIEFSGTRYDRLKRAIKATVQENQQADRRNFSINFATNGKWSIDGWGFLHKSKMSEDLQWWLENEGVSKRNTDELCRRLSGNDGWVVVPRGVGEMVVSCVADNIAESLGYDSITDNNLAFALTALNGVESLAAGRSEGVLAERIATTMIPGDIDKMSEREYAKLRSGYSEARAEFGKMVREISQAERLDRIGDPIELRRRLDSVEQKVDGAVSAFRSSRAASKIRNWGPFALTTLAPILAGVAVNQATAGMVASGFSTVVRIVEKSLSPLPSVGYPKVYRMLCDVQAATAQAAIRTLR